MYLTMCTPCSRSATKASACQCQRTRYCGRPRGAVPVALLNTAHQSRGLVLQKPVSSGTTKLGRLCLTRAAGGTPRILNLRTGEDLLPLQGVSYGPAQTKNHGNWCRNFSFASWKVKIHSPGTL